MPRSLHGALAEAAEREGTSLNQFITGTLASAIGWGGDESLKEAPHARATTAGADESAQSRRLFVLLVVNALAVGLAGIAAIAILLAAWLG